MAETAADILHDTIHDWGVDVAHPPGQDPLHPGASEEAAAFMACGWAKFTGRLGCCLATSGPGSIHLLNGLYDAKMDKAARSRAKWLAPRAARWPSCKGCATT